MGMPHDLGVALDALAPRLEQNRRNWPLWTYDRERWNAVQCSWPDRWRFSGAYLHASFVAAAGLPDYWKRAMTTLIAHQTAPQVPSQLSPEVTNDFYGGVLDRDDASALATRVVEVLSDGLFLRMEDYTVAAAGGSNHPPRETPEALALQLCRDTGLLPARQKGAATGFDKETLRALDQEAREIARVIKQDPPRDEVTLAGELLERDPGWRKKLLHQEKEKRAGQLIVEPLVARWLLYPFLRFDEIETLVTTANTDAQSAYRLVVGRLIGSMTEGTYRKTLSR